MNPYIILTSSSEDCDIAAQDLEEKVNQKKKEGWVTQGGVSVTSHTPNLLLSEYTFAQAMEKKE